MPLPSPSWQLAFTKCSWVPDAVCTRLTPFIRSDWAVRRWHRGLRDLPETQPQQQDSHPRSTAGGPHSSIRAQGLGPLTSALVPAAASGELHWANPPAKAPLSTQPELCSVRLCYTDLQPRLTKPRVPGKAEGTQSSFPSPMDSKENKLPWSGLQ